MWIKNVVTETRRLIGTSDCTIVELTSLSSVTRPSVNYELAIHHNNTMTISCVIKITHVCPGPRCIQSINKTLTLNAGSTRGIISHTTKVVEIVFKVDTSVVVNRIFSYIRINQD